MNPICQIDFTARLCANREYAKRTRHQFQLMQITKPSQVLWLYARRYKVAVKRYQRLELARERALRNGE